ncbi:hypothetical protein OOK13_01500 [Streptomyces sp. NBC_00378]|uniref:DUF7134 domain-containing protein n=1 Tax=unclassified Streptomyces TaxID=2593676 RepID=UPI00224E541D|nr:MULTISPECIES: hypothetical protein [unclassified Streptomyces]MCX5107233.1 hypothetical protein [Streptomyces sp. NBC_00378]
MDPDHHPIPARRLIRRQHLALDCAFVFVYAATLLLTASTAVAPSSTALSPAPVPWERLVLIAVVGAPVAVRRIWPLPVLVFVLAVTVVAVARDATWDPFLAAAFAMYIVALTVPSHGWWQRWLPGPALAALSLAGSAGADARGRHVLVARRPGAATARLHRVARCMAAGTGRAAEM